MLDAVQLPGRHQVRMDRSRDALLTDFGRATLSRPLPDAGRGLPGPVRPRRVALRRQRRPCAAAVRLHQKLWFMPSTPMLSNGGTQRGLPISCFLNEADGQPGRHRRAVERERLAGIQGRRHRLLLGQSPLDRRAGRRGGQDLRRDPLHPGDGQPDAGDLAGLAAARIGRGVPADVAPRGRGIRGNPPPHRRRSEPQGAEPASRHPDARRLHARGGGG